MSLKKLMCRIDTLMPNNIFFWVGYGVIMGHALQNYPVGLALSIGIGALRNRQHSFLGRPLNLQQETCNPGIAELNQAGSEIKRLQLYYFTSCPYCIRVRFALWWMGLEIPLKNIRTKPDLRDELLAGGGKTQVPCLYIELVNEKVYWLYESGDIIRFLSKQVPGHE